MNNNKKGKKIGFCGKFYIFAPLINCFAMRALPWLDNLIFRQFGIEFLDNKKFIVNYKYNMTFSTHFSKKLMRYILGSLCVVHAFPFYSVRPKPGFGIGNRNQDQVSVSVSGPELFLPKPKLSPILKIYQKIISVMTWKIKSSI